VVRVTGHRWGWGALGIALALATDLVSSAWALDRLGSRQSAGSPGGLVQFRLVTNTGAGFGVGATHGPVVALLGTGALAVLLVLTLRAPTRLTAFLLGGAAGGGLGNLIDRTIGPHGAHSGAVIDWIHVGPYPPVFNVADIWIRVGLLATGLAMLVRYRRPHGVADDPSTSEPDHESPTHHRARCDRIRSPFRPDPTQRDVPAGSGLEGHGAAGSASPTERRS